MSDEVELRQVWTVAYDNNTPDMSGRRTVIRSREFDTKEEAEEVSDILDQRSHRSPKVNRRIQTRWVTEWEDN